MPDEAFRTLFTETENVRWDSMNQIRTRARRRAAARAATLAGVVTLALVSGGVAVARVAQEPVTPPAATASPAPQLSPSPAPAPPSPAPSRLSRPPASTPASTAPGRVAPPATNVTAAMMLRPQDAGSGYTSAPGTNGDWTFEFNAAVLGCPRGSRPDPRSERFVVLRKGKPQDENYVVQQTGRYAGDDAGEYLDGVRQRAASCSPGEGRSVRVAARGFAGDDSLLVVFDHGGGFLAKLVLVRKGNLLTEIYSKPVRSDAANRELGRRAAARL